MMTSSITLERLRPMRDAARAIYFLPLLASYSFVFRHFAQRRRHFELAAMSLDAEARIIAHAGERRVSRAGHVEPLPPSH